MLTQLKSFAIVGLEGVPITVEVGAIPGDGSMHIVGLGDTAVQESKQRVKLALRNAGYRIPAGRTITVNLAPADLKKIGPRFDLAIALGVLASLQLVVFPEGALARTAFLGELSLDGTLRHVSGILSSALACARCAFQHLIVPAEDGPEAALVRGIVIFAPHTLTDVVQMLCGERELNAVLAPPFACSEVHDDMDLCDIRGQQQAKRSLEIAAAGGHNLLLCGPPGVGKTLLARALRGILPPLNEQEALEVTQIYSVANLLPHGAFLIRARPFRAVHHTASAVSIVGGGQVPGPGEISLAHRGVLFLDELLEFPPHVLEVLRQPLEDRTITVTRAQGSVTFPADILLVAALNPSDESVPAARRHRQLSRAFVDRFDLTLAVPAVPMEDLQVPRSAHTEESQAVRSRVTGARHIQSGRLRGLPCSTNASMGVRHLEEFCALDAEERALLRKAAERLGLSARAYHRTIKVARTIADLEGCERIETPHLAEALQYRQEVGVGGWG